MYRGEGGEGNDGRSMYRVVRGNREASKERHTSRPLSVVLVLLLFLMDSVDFHSFAALRHPFSLVCRIETSPLDESIRNQSTGQAAVMKAG